MATPISSRRLHKVELVRVNQLRELLYDPEERVVVDNKKGGAFRHKLSKWLVEFSALSCLVDFMAHEPDDQDKSARIKSLQLDLFGKSISFPLLRYRSIQVSDWGRKARGRLWPYLLLLIWFAFVLQLGHILYHQYAYDYYVFRLARVRWLNRTQSSKSLPSYRSLEHEDFLLKQLDSRRRELELMGAVQVHMSFVVECAYISFAAISFALYVMPLVYFRCVTPLDSYFLRNLYDFQSEQDNNRRSVGSEVRKFARSIHNWSRALLETGLKLVDGRHVSSGATGHIDCASVQESLLIKQLNQMLTAGHLRPLNQRPNWVGSWSRTYNWLVVGSYAYALIVNLLAYISRSYLHFATFSKLNARGILVEIGSKYLIFLGHLSIGLYGISMAFTCWDQLLLVAKLRKWLSLIIELSHLRLRYRHRHKGALDDGKSEFQSSCIVVEDREDLGQQVCESLDSTQAIQAHTNRDILLFLMHYKIFIAQLDKQKRSLAIIALPAIFSMLMIPLLSRLHVPYFQMFKWRLLACIFSCIVLIPVDLALVPICYLNKRCIDLYLQLNSLLAHLIKINHHLSEANAAENHDRHILISMLRKELSHHDQAMKKFAIRLFGLAFNYDNLVGLHVYFGVLILSIVGENLAQIKEPTGTIFIDPLGLF